MIFLKDKKERTKPMRMSFSCNMNLYKRVKYFSKYFDGSYSKLVERAVNEFIEKYRNQ